MSASGRGKAEGDAIAISCTCSVVVGGGGVVVVVVVVVVVLVVEVVLGVVAWSMLFVECSVCDSTSARAPKMETVTDGEWLDVSTLM